MTTVKKIIKTHLKGYRNNTAIFINPSVDYDILTCLESLLIVEKDVNKGLLLSLLSKEIESEQLALMVESLIEAVCPPEYMPRTITISMVLQKIKIDLHNSELPF